MHSSWRLHIVLAARDATLRGACANSEGIGELTQQS